jgi:hypothetical protein
VPEGLENRAAQEISFCCFIWFAVTIKSGQDSSVLSKVKSVAKRITPRALRVRVGEYLAERWNTKHAGGSVEEIFSAIYSERRWKMDSDENFCSGEGSHRSGVVLPYITAVKSFLGSLPHAPSVVDLGCGDFEVAGQLRDCCGPYVACDVVPALIQRNKERFADARVDFRCLDIIDDELPEGEIAFLRQVLQHLSNAQILKVIPKLYAYKFLVLTEHLSADSDFTPNRDKPTGGGTRLPQRSGIVLTEPPFLLRVKSQSVLCSINESIAHRPGVIKTTLYKL